MRTGDTSLGRLKSLIEDGTVADLGPVPNPVIAVVNKRGKSKVFRLKKIVRALDEPGKKLRKSAALVEEMEGFVLARFSGYVGNRSSAFRKRVFDPYCKLVDKEMRSLKGRWDGRGGYVFKTQELLDAARPVMDKLNANWASILKENPENAVDVQGTITAEFFKWNDKSGNPNR